MISLQELLTKYKNTDFQAIQEDKKKEKIRKSFYDLDHNTGKEIILDIDYYTVSKECLKFCINNKKDSKDNDIFKLFLSVKFSNGKTLLHVLIEDELKESSELKEIKNLLISQANRGQLNAKDDDGRTPLHLAVLWENFELVEILIKHGAEVNAKDNDERTPLHLAAKGETLKVVKSLRELGKANVNAQDSKRQTPLHCAAKIVNLEVVEYLITDDTTVNAKDKDGNTPLHYSCEWGNVNGWEHLRVVNYLIKIQEKSDAGEEIDPRYYQLLKECLKVYINDKVTNRDKGKKKAHNILRRLLLVKFSNGKTLLDLVIKEDRNILRRLLSVKFSNGRTLLHVLIEDSNILRRLLSVKFSNGRTLLHVLIEEIEEKDLDIKENLELIKLLINKSSVEQLNTQDNDGKTPLDYAQSLKIAIYSNKQNIIKLLVKELSKHQAKNACYATAMFTTIMANTLFTTGTLASTKLNIIYAAGIIPLSTLIMSYLAYNLAFNYYSTPSPKLENTETEQNITQVPSAA